MLLVHARDASPNVGTPSVNKNNHPFISSDKATALIHNGRIHEFDSLTKKYEVKSSCDSEVLLRIFEERGELEGIKDIWRQITRGHMAVAIGQRDEATRRLWLFRNTWRTLWVVDLRKQLGQIFFTSTADIWQQAADRCKFLSKTRGQIALYEVPPYEIWSFETDDDKEIKVEKYEVERGLISKWAHEGPRQRILEEDSVTEIITELDDNEEVVFNGNKKKMNGHKHNGHKHDDHHPFRQLYDGGMTNQDWAEQANCQERVLKALEQMRDISNDIEIIVENSPDNFTFREADNLAESLEQTVRDLQGSLRMCEH